MSPKAEARHEHQRSSDTSPIDAARPPKTRAKWLSCRHLDFSDSRSIFFIATHPVWFGCQCSVVVKPISRLPDSSVQKQGFLDGFLDVSRSTNCRALLQNCSKKPDTTQARRHCAVSVQLSR